MTLGDEVVLTSADVAVTIDLARGARATRWSVGGSELLTRYGAAPEEGGMYPMAPWAGRIEGNSVVKDGERFAMPVTYGPWAIHGTVHNRPVEVSVLDQGQDEARLVATSRTHPEWPWPMEVDIDWRLSGRVVTTEIVVRALEAPMPAVVGWHPWFARSLDRGGPLQWSVEATRQAVRGEGYLPTGELVDYDPAAGPFDDTFVVPSGRSRVVWPGALRLDIVSSGQWYVVFDQLPPAVCIEPQSGPPDGVNRGIGEPVPVAEPGRPLRLLTTWTVSDDPPGDPA